MYYQLFYSEDYGKSWTAYAIVAASDVDTILETAEEQNNLPGFLLKAIRL